MGCSFCKIVRESQSIRIYEDENVLAFPPLKDTIISRGHMLVIPKKHYADFYDIPNRELHHVFDAVKTISKKLKEKYKAEGVNILHANGSQQSVFHFHIHLIPRYKNDCLDTWPETGYTEENFTEVYEEIANLLRN